MRRALVSRVLAATAATAVVLLAGAVPAGALTRDPFQPTGGAATVAAGSGTTATTSAPSSGGTAGSGGTTATTAAAGSAGSGGTTATTAAPTGTGGQTTTAGSGGATTPTGPGLPVTGTRTSGPLLLGLFSLAVGGVLAYIGRRRWDARRYVRC